MPPKIPSTVSFDSAVPMPEGILRPKIYDWLNENEGKDLATAAGTRGRGSFAGRCSRDIAFQVLGFERNVTIPPNVLMAFSVGHSYHHIVQSIAEAHLGAESEVVGDWRPEHDMSTHADLVYMLKMLDREVKVVGEIKSMSGYGFALATGAKFSDDGPGPKMDHVIQAAISALAPNIQAQLIHMIYIDKDKHGIAEWLIDVDQPFVQWGGSPRDLVTQELERMGGILGRIDSGMLPARWIPGHGRVDDPPNRNAKGDPWNCRYCAFQPTCCNLETGPVPIELAREIHAKAGQVEGS